MYVIFPADEVVYLSYGRLIYVPKSQEVGAETENLPSATPSNQQVTNNHSNPSVPSTSTSSTRSFHSVTSGPTLSSYSEDLQESSCLRRETLQSSVKSNKSWPQPSTSKYKTQPPARPARTKKKRITLDIPLEASVNKTSDLLKLPFRKSKSKSPVCDRKLSYLEYVEVYGSKTEASIEPLMKNSNSNTDKIKSTKTVDKKENKSVKSAQNQLKNCEKLLVRENTPVNSDRNKKEWEHLQSKGLLHNSKGKELMLNAESRLQLTSSQQLTPEKTSVTKKSIFNYNRNKTSLKMAGIDSPLRDLTHPSYNEHLKAHNAVTFKLVRTVSDFTQQLGQIYEQQAEELQLLVSNFKKKNLELRKERPACPSSLFHVWETLLQEVEIDSQALGDVASILGRQISRPLLERSFFRKIQSRKVFSHRESYETIVTKTEEKLAKCRQEYKAAYLAYLSTPTTESLSGYFNNHNAYVQQLHATNGMLDAYAKETLPQLLQELDEIYTDLCSSISEAILQEAEVVSTRANEKQRRYENLISQCRAISATTDLANLARSMPTPQGRGLTIRRPFIAPQPPPPDAVDGGEPSEIINDNVPPPLKDQLVIDRLSAVQVQPAHDALRKESADLDAQIRQIQDSLETLLRIQQRSLESALFNKVNELQEDISMKRFDVRVAQMHLSAINSQKELFLNKLESTDSVRERKMSLVSTGSMKNKWLKAFKSLKTPPPSASPKETEKKNQMYHAVSTIIAMRKNGSTTNRDIPRGDPDCHTFQEYTYKKITPCDVCSQILRGHTRQGLKCRFCKMNVHVDCQDKAPKCQPKSRLLRRQKSTSEIESRVPESTVEEEKGSEVDQIYQVLKQAGEISNNKPRVNLEPVPPIGITVDRGNAGSAPGSSGSSGQSLNRKGCPPTQSQRAQGSSLTVNNPAPCSTSSAPHSPRRQKLNLRMKSLSLDSPESTEHVQRRRHHGVSTTSEPHSKESSSSRIQSPSSPVHNRRLLSAKNIRMSSVELPDDNDKSPSSASTSPCPSPVGAKKTHRLLPTNLYVVLYNFKSRHQDELDLKAGDKVTVIDFSDPDWWKGKCLGRVGYFPSKYCSKLAAGEKPLQVTHNLQLSDGENGLMLLRDQIVIQIGEEIDGMVMIRSGDNRQGVCPVKFLQEV
ncbi:hypothetical protein FQR65_LT02921 [Abscondita terminalis]|nr:hypothetical protein FQR65_LT02921 [Abscondita terminalis]